MNSLLYERLFKDLEVSYRAARKHKLKTKDENSFDLNSVDNLEKLATAIYTREYIPSKGIAFVTDKPVIREIFAAPFPDRIVHHYIHMKINDYWERHLLPDCYSCRENKGTDYAVRRLYQKIRKVSHNFQHAETTCVVKIDIQGYFMHLDHKLLLQLALRGLRAQYKHKQDVESRFDYQTTAFLLNKIINDDATTGVEKRGNLDLWRILPDSKSLFKQPKGKGLVIGNLTSQLLSNVFLHNFDFWISENKGFRGRYGRYVDDAFFVLKTSELHAFMSKTLPEIRDFLKGMGLTLHPHKTKIFKITTGVPFMGVKIYPYRILPDSRILQNYRLAVHLVAAGQKDPDDLVSYLGRFQHLDSNHIQAKIWAEVGWEWHYDPNCSSLFFTNPKEFNRKKALWDKEANTKKRRLYRQRHRGKRKGSREKNNTTNPRPLGALGA